MMPRMSELDETQFYCLIELAVMHDETLHDLDRSATAYAYKSRALSLATLGCLFVANFKFPASYDLLQILDSTNPPSIPQEQ